MLGNGSSGGTMQAALAAVANILGSGTAAAAVTGKLEAVSALAGIGKLDSSAYGIWALVASLLGEGGSNGSPNAKANPAAGIFGSSGVIANTRGYADMGANIVVAGELLTTSNIASSVWESFISSHGHAGTMGEALLNASSSGNPWDTEIDGTYTAADVLRIVASALAGKASGGGTPEITMRNLSDTDNIIVMNVDVNGNRGAVQLTP